MYLPDQDGCQHHILLRLPADCLVAAQVLNDVKAAQRVLLTGTPLQNNVAELFMLMHFLDKGKFDDLEDFEAEFADISHGEQVRPSDNPLC